MNQRMIPLHLVAMLMLSLLPLRAQSQVVWHPAPVAKKKTADKKFWTLVTAAYATAYADEEITQSALSRGFHESNPILGQSRLRAYPIITGLATASVVESYFLKKDGSKWWAVPVTVTVGIHGFAVGYNLVLTR